VVPNLWPSVYNTVPIVTTMI